MRTKPVPKQRVDIKIIDNFLSEDTFRNLSKFVMEFDDDKICWRYAPNVEWEGSEKFITYPYKGRNRRLFYMIANMMNKKANWIDHTLMDMPIFSQIFGKSSIPNTDDLKLLRVKMNLYPGTEKIYEHAYHIDYNYEHMSGIFSLNTCDGYTKSKDGTKVDSVANRMLIFNGLKEHCSTTTTNAAARFNININWLT